MAAQIELPDGHVATYNGSLGWECSDPKSKVVLEYFTEKAMELMAGEYHPNEIAAIATRVAGMIVGARVIWVQPLSPRVAGRAY